MYMYVSVWVCAYECRCPRNWRESLVVSHPMWLRTELMSSARAVCTLQC